MINTQSPPTGGYGHIREAAQSSDYKNGIPYPSWAFGPAQWPVERGPIPTALPFAKTIINEGADFVFQGGPPTFSVSDNPNADDFLADVIKANHLNSRYNAIARLNGNVGTVAAKFSYDSDAKGAKVRISFLSCPEECRVWMDPHDQQAILMARIQYPYRAAGGHWFYHREEWTADHWVTYNPKTAGDASVTSVASLPGYSLNYGDGDDWEIDRIQENPFGLIPIHLLKNVAVEGSPLGVGDCWEAFRLMDRIALTLHGEDRSNQQHSSPVQVFVNADLKNSGEVLPNEPLDIKNQNPEGPAADFKLVEPTGAAREYSFRSIEKWEDLLYKACGLSLLDPATLSNKGNMTRLALMTAYSRTVATSDLKRTNYGEAGLCLFFRSLLVGMSRTGAFAALSGLDEMVDVQCEWPDYFAATDADLSDLTDRTVSQVNANLLPTSRAVTRLATAEGIDASEHETLLKELDDENAKRDAKEKAIRMESSGSAVDQGSDALSELSDSSGANNFSS